MSHISRILRNKSQNIFLVLGHERGLRCYHYLLAHPLKKKFLEALEGQHVDLLEYGSVIASGYGMPSQHLQNKMRYEYDFDPQEEGV